MSRPTRMTPEEEKIYLQGQHTAFLQVARFAVEKCPTPPEAVDDLVRRLEFEKAVHDSVDELVEVLARHLQWDYDTNVYAPDLIRRIAADLDSNWTDAAEFDNEDDLDEGPDYTCTCPDDGEDADCPVCFGDD